MIANSKTMMLEMLLSKGEVDRTFALLSQYDDRQLSEVLDSHLAGEIEDTTVREALDKAIGHLGLVELGIQLDVVGKPDENVLALLSIPAVQRYAFRYYPQLLPLLLYDRLRGKPSVNDPFVPDTSIELFGHVLMLDGRLEKQSIAYFLDVVDDYGDEDSPDIADIIAAIRKPEKLRRYLAFQGEPKKKLDLACLGLLDFLEWSNMLKIVIDRADSKLEASAIWHQFGYWMNLIGGQLYGVLAASLEGVRNHKTPFLVLYANDARDYAELDAQLESLRQLTSSLYAAPLESWRQKHYQPPEPQELVFAE